MQKKKKVKHKIGRDKKNTYILIRFEDSILDFMREHKKQTSIEFRHMANEGMKLYAEQTRKQQATYA